MKNVSLSGAPQLCTSGSRDRTYISGTGAALPSIRLTNEDLSGFLDTSDDWITERVGIKCRYICSPKETTVSMAEDAARQALMQAGLSAEELDLIVFATVTPDQQLPSAAALLAQRLGVNNTLAFDVKAACAGFLAAMATADSLLQSMGLTHALVIGSESLSRMIDWSDRTTAVLFGDGAGACILSRPLEASAGAVVASHLCTDGSAAQFIERPGKPFPEPVAPATAQLNQQLSPYVRMSGREVFRAGIQHMTSSILEVLKTAAKSIEDVALFIPHQSNSRMITSVARNVGLDDHSKISSNIESVGNTSAASIPIALHECVLADRVQPGDLLLLTAVGSGMMYGSILLEW